MESNEETPRDLILLDDLLGAVFFFGSICLLLLLELARRKLCSIQQFAFLLSAVTSTFVVGGFVDHIISDVHLSTALFGQYYQQSIVSYKYLPFIFICLSSGVVTSQLWFCTCSCCCAVGKRALSHQGCRIHRFCSNIPIFCLSFITLFILLGLRLNARLRSSFIKPLGGSLHWVLLGSPFLVSLLFAGAVGLTLLHFFIMHTGKASELIDSIHNATLNYPATKPHDFSQPPAYDTSVMTPLSKEIIHSHAKAIDTGPDWNSSHLSLSKQSYSRPPRGVKDTRKQLVAKLKKGDVSEYISSDSDSDDEVLTPSISSSISSKTDIQRRLRRRGFSNTSTLLSSDTDIDNEECDTIRNSKKYTRYFDETLQRVYFYCETTGESTWEIPAQTRSKWQ